MTNKKRFRFVSLCVVFLTILLLGSIASYYYRNFDQCVEERVSFDFGTGFIKGKIGVVDKCQHKIIATKEFAEIRNQLVPCFEKNQRGEVEIAELCFATTLDKFIKLKQVLGVDCKKQTCKSIATEWARRAINSDQLLQQLNFHGANVRKITQEEEGGTALKAVLGYLNNKKFKDDLVVFDIGGGSFQISTFGEEGKVVVFLGNEGIESYHKLLKSRLGLPNDRFLTIAEGERIIQQSQNDFGIMIAKNSTIHEKMAKTKSFFAIGGPIQKGLMYQLNTGRVINEKKLLTTAELFVGKTLHEVTASHFHNLRGDYALTAQFSCFMLAGIMRGAGIDEMIISDATLNDYVLLNDF